MKIGAVNQIVNNTSHSKAMNNAFLPPRVQDVKLLCFEPAVEQAPKSNKPSLLTKIVNKICQFEDKVDRFVHLKILPPINVRNRASDIFLRQISEDEAVGLQKKYQDIMKIKDKDEFLDTAFLELKKDFGLENIPIKLDKNHQYGRRSGNLESQAVFRESYEDGYLQIAVSKGLSNKTLLCDLTHELRHAKQNMYIYRVTDKREIDEIYTARIYDMWRNKLTPKQKNFIAKHFANSFTEFYDKLKLPKLYPDEDYFYWARRMADAKRAYCNNSMNAYEACAIEKDAQNAADIMEVFVENRILGF